MGKRNCWEFKRCGRQPGGTHVADLGTCPATTEERVDGMNGGLNAGRACWAVAGTLCGGVVQGTFAQKLQDCSECEFYTTVRDDEGPALAKASDILAKIL